MAKLDEKVTTAIEENAKLINEFKEIADMYNSGLLMDIELLEYMHKIGGRARRPEKGEIDPNTGLSHRTTPT